jgi:hypothetical protein
VDYKLEHNIQHGEVSLNIKRGLVALVDACMDRLKQKGVPHILADGLGDVLVTGVRESSTIPDREISMTDLARAAGVLKRKGGRRAV